MGLASALIATGLADPTANRQKPEAATCMNKSSSDINTVFEGNAFNAPDLII